MPDAQLLQYLRLITLQLRGPVQQAIDKDHMASHLLGCITNLLGSLVAEREPADKPSRTADAGLLEQEQQRQRIYQRQRCTHAEGPTDREVEPLSEAELQRLMRLLREHCEEGPSLAVSALRALSGGFSKQTSVSRLSAGQSADAMAYQAAMQGAASQLREGFTQMPQQVVQGKQSATPELDHHRFFSIREPAATWLGRPHGLVSCRRARTPLGYGLDVQSVAGGKGAGRLLRRLELGSNSRCCAG